MNTNQEVRLTTSVPGNQRLAIQCVSRKRLWVYRPPEEGDDEDEIRAEQSNIRHRWSRGSRNTCGGGCVNVKANDNTGSLLLVGWFLPVMTASWVR